MTMKIFKTLSKNTWCKHVPITDLERGEIYCRPCGIVLSEKLVEKNSERTYGLEQGSNNSRTGAALTLTRVNMGLNATINSIDVDSLGNSLSNKTKSKFNRLRKLDNSSKQKSTAERNFTKAMVMLDAAKKKLGLPDSIAENTALLYRRASKNNLIRGRTVNGILASCIYAACRESSIPRSLDEISETLNINRKRLARIYRILVNSLNINPEPPRAVDFLAKIASQLQISEKTKRIAINLLIKTDKMKLGVGYKPTAICASVLRIACIKNNEHRTLNQISHASGISMPTIRKTILVFNDKLMKDKISS